MLDNCPYYKWDGGIFGDYYCVKKEERVPSATYEKYCRKSYERDGYGDCPIYKHVESSSSCYITTIVCDILGLDDKNIFLEIFRKFRKDYLQKRPDMLQLLEEYDFIGPLIAHRIINDSDKKSLALSLFSEYIFPITKDIFNRKYCVAIKKYLEMTSGLTKKYGFETLSLTIPGCSKYDFSKDYSSYGHGKRYFL